MTATALVGKAPTSRGACGGSRLPTPAMRASCHGSMRRRLVGSALRILGRRGCQRGMDCAPDGQGCGSGGWSSGKFVGEKIGDPRNFAQGFRAVGSGANFAEQVQVARFANLGDLPLKGCGCIGCADGYKAVLVVECGHDLFLFAPLPGGAVDLRFAVHGSSLARNACHARLFYRCKPL